MEFLLASIFFRLVITIPAFVVISVIVFISTDYNLISSIGVATPLSLLTTAFLECSGAIEIVGTPKEEEPSQDEN